MAISASSIAGSSTLNELRTQFNNLVTDVTAIEGGSISYTTLNTTTTNATTLNVKEDGTIVFEGASDDAYETTLTVVDPTADRTITFPNTSGTVVVSGDGGFTVADGGTIGSTSTTDAMTISSAGIVTFKDDIILKDAATIGVTSSTSAISIASTGIVTFVDDIIIKDGGTIGSASDVDAITIAADGDTTFSQDVIVTGDLTVSGDDITMGTNTAGHLLIADGTNFNPIAVTDLSAISTIASGDTFLAVDASGGGLKKVARSVLVSGLATSSALNNISEDTSPQLGGNLDMNGQDIVTTSNATIDLAPNGTGTVVVRGNTNSGAIKFNCEDNSHGQILIAQPHSASVTNTSILPAGASSTLVSLVSTDTLTNKTLTSPVINTGTFGTSILPTSADGTTLGSASKEFSDLFLADASTIQFGNDQEIKLTHVADTGLLLTDSGGTPTLQFHDANESFSSDGSKIIMISGGTTFNMPTSDGTDGQALATNGSGTLSFVSVAANTPSSADGQALGSASLEWSDLFLADGGTIQFGNDQEVILTHVADVGLKLSHEATGDNLPIVLNLESEEDDIVSGEEIGRIDFTAGDSGGTDAILTAASIAATAEDTFAADNNSTGLAFKLGVSAAATEMFRMTHDGDFKIITDGSALGFGANNEIELTHVHNVGLLLTDSGGTPTLQLHDANESVSSDGSNLFLTSGGTAYSLTATDGSDGHFLKTDGSGALTFAAASVSDLACDNLSVGDAAVVISTSSGNITLDATANDSDIIFKGTDGTADTTFLTIDGSDAGKLLPNNGMDLNGKELILDADADTSITADTDDTIDIRIAGADDFQITANSFNALSGSSIVVDSGATLSIPSGGVISGPGFVGKVLVFSGIFGS